MVEENMNRPEMNVAENVDDVLTEEQRERAAKILGRESTRTRLVMTLSLPACLLGCIALAAGMNISSLYIVSGGAVAGLLLWGVLISQVSLAPGSAGHRLFIAGDRSSEDDELMQRYTAQVKQSVSANPDNSEH